MGKISIANVISLRTLQQIQDNFSDAAGIPISLRDLNNKLITRISNKSKLWSFIEQNPAIKAEWNKDNLKVIEKSVATGELIIYERKAEIYTFTVPVTVNNKMVAFFIGGFVRFGNPNIELCLKAGEDLGLSLDEFLDLFLQLPLVTRKKMEAAGSLLKMIANRISTLEIEGNLAKAQAKKMFQDKEYLQRKIQNQSDNLLKSEARYEQLFNSIQDGVYFVDMEGRITDINAAGAKMLGYEPAELIGKFARDNYVIPSDRNVFEQEIMKYGKVQNFYARLKTKHGNEVMFETNAVIIKDQHGQNTGLQGIFRDITARQHHPLSQHHTTHVEQQTFSKHSHH